MSKYFLIILVIIVISLIVFLVWGGLWSSKKENPALASFAQCLASKNITMYGAAWCSHCQNEKANFGDAFKYVSYVECPKNTKKCLDLGILGYPTWIFPDSRRFEGEQGLEKLAQESGCVL